MLILPQALEAAKTAIGRFEAAGIAWQRPADYYAEMVRFDAQLLHTLPIG